MHRSSFGRQVRREATVTALDDCYLLQFTPSDMAGLNIELAEVRAHVIAQILEKTNFFSSLSKAQRDALALLMDVKVSSRGLHACMHALHACTQASRDLTYALALLMDVKYHPTGSIVFNEGAPGEAMLILVEGCVGAEGLDHR